MRQRIYDVTDDPRFQQLGELRADQADLSAQVKEYADRLGTLIDAHGTLAQQMEKICDLIDSHEAIMARLEEESRIRREAVEEVKTTLLMQHRPPTLADIFPFNLLLNGGGAHRG